MTGAATVDPREVATFDALAQSWWDPAGPMRQLHRMNPVRLAFLRDVALARYGRGGDDLRPLAGLRALDIGCGAGLATEPLVRLGALTTGIDAAPANIAAAQDHAAAQGLAIDYRCAAVEELAAAADLFDLTVAFEVIEHVSDPDGFMAGIAALTAPGGLFIGSTLDRTVASFAFGIVAAERLLGWAPPGAHEWRKFLRPHEFARLLRRHGFGVLDVAGMAYDPVGGNWRLERRPAINYLIAARRLQAARA